MSTPISAPETAIYVTVNSAGDGLVANPAQVAVAKGKTAKLRWIPDKALKITYVGFDNPVGPGCSIGTPGPDANNPSQWTADDSNTEEQTCEYSIYAMTAEGVTLSVDPEVLNGGQGG